MKIFCVECDKKVEARLTNGAEVYPHRSDLKDIPLWKCDACKNTVGCHYKTNSPTSPLGCIPSRDLKLARQHIHQILDPLWRSGEYTRKQLYKMISDEIGWTYHTSKLRSMDEARQVYAIIHRIKNGEQKTAKEVRT